MLSSTLPFVASEMTRFLDRGGKPDRLYRAKLSLAFIALAIGWLSESVNQFAANSNTWIHIGGWIGLLTAIAAWYASFAAVTNFTFKRVVLPVFPR